MTTQLVSPSLDAVETKDSDRVPDDSLTAWQKETLSRAEYKLEMLRSWLDELISGVESVDVSIMKRTSETIGEAIEALLDLHHPDIAKKFHYKKQESPLSKLQTVEDSCYQQQQRLAKLEALLNLLYHTAVDHEYDDPMRDGLHLAKDLANEAFNFHDVKIDMPIGLVLARLAKQNGH